MTLTTTNLKPEQVRALLRNSTPGPWNAFHKSKYDEWHVSVPLEDGSGMTLGLFRDGIETNHREADARLIALAPELAQGWIALHAAVPTPEQAAEAEGLRAALGGCAGTHNPHVFGDVVLREAWARGMRQVHAYRDRELEIQADKARGLPWHHIETGAVYAEVCRAQVQASTGALDEGDEVVVYRGADGQAHVREADEFLERFTQLAGWLHAEPGASSLPLLPVLVASGGAGEVSRNDTPERLPELVGEFGDHYADVDLEAGETELPVMLTLYHAALLEVHEGGDEADAALPLSFEDAEALGMRLIEQARRGRASVSAR